MSENFIALCAAVCFCAAVIGVTTYNLKVEQYRANSISKMVEKGYTPVEAACALDGGRLNLPACVIVASNPGSKLKTLELPLKP